MAALLSQVLREGASRGIIRSDLDFDLMAEALLGMIRGVQRYKADHVALDEAVHTVVAAFLGGTLIRKNGN